MTGVSHFQYPHHNKTHHHKQQGGQGGGMHATDSSAFCLGEGSYGEYCTGIFGSALDENEYPGKNQNVQSCLRDLMGRIRGVLRCGRSL